MDIERSRGRRLGRRVGTRSGDRRRLHAAGAKVVIADVNPEKGEPLAQELGVPFVAVRRARGGAGPGRGRHGGQGVGRPADRGLLRRHRHPDEGRVEPKGPHPLEAFKVILDINLVGTFNVHAPRGRSRCSPNEPDAEDGERGVLVNTASVAAFEGQIGQIAYSASKGGVVGMTLPAARDLADKGIRVVHDRARASSTRRCSRRCPRSSARRSARRCRSRAGSASPTEFAQLAAHIVENPMLNGETIRLDGAIRMAPK